MADLGTVIQQLLREMPRGRRRPTAHLVIGPSMAQFKPLPQVARNLEAELVERIAVANVDAFFLRNGAPLLCGGAVRGGDGEWWAAALDRPVTESAIKACGQAGVRLAGCTALAAVLHRSFVGPVASWQDGDVTLEISTADGRITAARRSRSMLAGEEQQLAAGLQTWNGDGRSVADAWAAASIAFEPVRTILPQPDSTGWRGDVPARLAAGALTMTVLIAAAAPIFSVVRPARTLRAGLEGSATHIAEYHRTENLLHDITQVFADAARFDARRIPTSLLLMDLANTVPAGSVLESFSLQEGSEAVIVVRSANVASLLSALGDVRGITDVRVSGAVSKDLRDGIPSHRLTLRLSLDAAAFRRKMEDGG
jgi:hypothetical protein